MNNWRLQKILNKDNLIEELFKNSDVTFFVNKKLSILFSSRDKMYEERYNEELAEVSALEAYNLVKGDIVFLEEVIEKTYGRLLFVIPGRLDSQ